MICRALLRCCKEVYQRNPCRMSIGRDRAARRRMHAMLHFTRMEEIAAGRRAISRTILERLQNLWRIARTSWFPGRRKCKCISDMRRYRYERPVKYSVQSLHLTPRDFEPARPGMEHHRARPASERSTPTAISHLLPSRAAPRNPHHVHGIVEPRRPKPARTMGRLPLAYLASTAPTQPNDELKALRRRR